MSEEVAQPDPAPAPDTPPENSGDPPPPSKTDLDSIPDFNAFRRGERRADSADQAPEPEGNQEPEPKPDTEPRPEAKKKPAEYAKERRERKATQKQLAEKAAEYQKELEEARQRLQEFESRTGEFESKQTTWETEKSEYESRTGELARQVEEANKRYYHDHQGRINPATDEQLLGANEQYLNALDRLPDYIPGENGEEQTLFVKQLREKNAESKNMQDAAVGLYMEARSEADPEKQREAVKRFTEAIGGDTDDPELRGRVSEVLKSAVPHARAILDRQNELTKNAGDLAKQNWEARHKSMNDLMGRVAQVSEEEIAATLQRPDADPTSDDFLFAAANYFSNQVPELRDKALREIALDAEAAAIIDAQYQLPPLDSDDPEAIKKHHEKGQMLIGRQADILKNAAMMRVIGPAIPVLLQRMLDAEARADAAAEDETPAGSPQGGRSDPDQGAGTSDDPWDRVPDDFKRSRAA